MISIVTVNFNAYDFLDLLVESLDRFSTVHYDLIVIDNSDPRHRLDKPRIYQQFMPANLGHGRGLNQGVNVAFEQFRSNPFVMFLDVDCHVLCHNWEIPFVMSMKHFDIVGARGVPEKPIRPACMFMRKEVARKYDWADTTGYRGHRETPGGFDVAIKAYYKIMADNLRIGFIDGVKSHYGTLNGEDYVLDQTPLVYHHWHGSHLVERQIDFPNDNLLADKSLLFSKIPWRLL